MGKIIIKNVVIRKPNYLYYVDGKGNVCEVEFKKEGKPKILAKGIIKRKKGYLYSVDEKGNVCEKHMPQSMLEKESKEFKPITRNKGIENLMGVRKKIIDFSKDNFKIFPLENLEHEETILDFEKITKDKFNLEAEGICWHNKNYIEFLEFTKESGIKVIYLCAPQIVEEDYEEADEFEQEKILSKHEDEIPFLIVGFFLNKRFHYCELSTDWFEECKGYNGEDRGYKGEQEKKDVEGYGRKVANHPDFPQYMKNLRMRRIFIENNFPEIYKELDEWEVNEVGSTAKDLYEIEIKNKDN